MNGWCWSIVKLFREVNVRMSVREGGGELGET